MQHLSTSMFPSQSLAGAVVSEAEIDRLRAVARYSVLDTPAEGAFDRITRLAAQLFEVPIAIVSIIDHDRIWFKSAEGLPGVTELPREPGLCSSAIEGGSPLVVESALEHPSARGNSLVTGPFGLRFYVGVPLATSDGFNLGTLCVVDREPRRADADRVDMLVALAKIVVDELELRLAARALALESERRADAEARSEAARDLLRTDELTGLRNRRAFERDLEDRYAAFGSGDVATGGLAVIDIDGLKSVNDTRGHDAGDRLLRGFAAALVTAFVGRTVYRTGGDEFVVMGLEESWNEAAVRRGVGEAVRSVREDGFAEAGASFGHASFREVDGSPRGALRLADSRMYGAKIAGRPVARAAEAYRPAP